MLWCCPVCAGSSKKPKNQSRTTPTKNGSRNALRRRKKHHRVFCASVCAPRPRFSSLRGEKSATGFCARAQFLPLPQRLCVLLKMQSSVRPNAPQRAKSNSLLSSLVGKKWPKLGREKIGIGQKCLPTRLVEEFQQRQEVNTNFRESFLREKKKTLKKTQLHDHQEMYHLHLSSLLPGREKERQRAHTQLRSG